VAVDRHARGLEFYAGMDFGSAVSGLGGFAGGPLVTRPVQGVAPFLSGGGFGPESSLFALLLSLAASGAVLWLAWVRGGFQERAASA